MDEIQLFANKHRLKTRISEDGTRIIGGKYGHIYEYDKGALGVMVMPNPPRKNYWGHIRTRLLKAGFVVVQDGDCEGAATFDPKNANQAELAIRAAGIKRKRKLSTEQRELQSERLRGCLENPECHPYLKCISLVGLNPLKQSSGFKIDVHGENFGLLKLFVRFDFRLPQKHGLTH